jgi:hypothetical protein
VPEKQTELARPQNLVDQGAEPGEEEQRGSHRSDTIHEGLV